MPSADSPRRDPSYRKKKTPHGTYAIVTLPDGYGGRRDFLLGKYGTKESKAEYRRRLAEWEAAGYRLPKESEQADVTVNELAASYWQLAEKHYRQPDGTPTTELEEYRLALRPVLRLYGDAPAKDFGPLALKAIQAEMIRQPITKKVKARNPDTGEVLTDPKTGKPLWTEKLLRNGLARGVVNKRLSRIKRVFKWGVSEQLVPVATYQALATVEGLRRGRSEARETKPVKPVAMAFVEQTLPHLWGPVPAMVELQLATGMRPGELVVMRGIDLEMSGDVWFYRPGSDQGPEGAHKEAWRGHQRAVAIGPRGQEILRPWLRTNLTEYVFQPRDALMARWTAQRQARKTRVQPSQQDRRRKSPKVRPGERYSVASYRRAIERGCEKAGVPIWHPHQLRHTKATEIRREFGLDGARAVLGHRSPVITEHYAELDMGKAAEVAAKLG